jgi:hypothetical protein
VKWLSEEWFLPLTGWEWDKATTAYPLLFGFFDHAKPDFD